MDNNSITSEDLQKAIQEDRKRRESECTAKLEALLKEYNCMANPVIRFYGDGSTQASIEIIAK